MVSAPVRRRQVAYAHKRGLLIRRACALIGVARSALRYHSVRPAKDQRLIESLRAVAARYPRYGYRRAWVLVGREGVEAGKDRVYRLWRAEGLQVPKKRRRRRVAVSRPRPQPATGPNEVWAYDFVFDACANGQRLKCLTVVDEWTRECLAIDAAGRIRSGRVIELLSKLISVRGAPTCIRSDNGPEFVSTAVLKWLTDSKIETVHITPGSPWENGTLESFNGKLRDECLSMEWFRSRAEAAAVIETWRRHYNRERPHSSLNYLTPNEFRRRYEKKRQKAASLQ
jgi:putative transposase